MTFLRCDAKYRRVEITIETDRVLIIRSGRSIEAWCGVCGAEVSMINFAQCEALTGMTGQMLRDSAETQGWHLVEGSDGMVLICLESVLKSM